MNQQTNTSPQTELQTTSSQNQPQTTDSQIEPTVISQSDFDLWLEYRKDWNGRR